MESAPNEIINREIPHLFQFFPLLNSKNIQKNLIKAKKKKNSDVSQLSFFTILESKSKPQPNSKFSNSNLTLPNRKWPKQNIILSSPIETSASLVPHRSQIATLFKAKLKSLKSNCKNLKSNPSTSKSLRSCRP